MPSHKICTAILLELEHWSLSLLGKLILAAEFGGKKGWFFYPRNVCSLYVLLYLSEPTLNKMGFLFPAPGPESSHPVPHPRFRHRERESREIMNAGEP